MWLQGERFINRSVVFSLDISANPVTMEAFRELKIVMVDPVDDPRTSATPILSETVKRPSTGTTITLLTP